MAGGRQGGENPWPLEFTPEARRAEFLWIAETPDESFQVWEDFGGVYDYVDAKTPKPGAKVYARFSDPTTEIAGAKPIYLASQFYGAGRVYFQGSGEMWRLRGESDSYFDSYYTKLIRWISEGRLLRDSNRGVLLVDSSKAMVGDTITVRAVLTDEQFEPLDVPEVPAKLLAPGGRIDDLRLLPLKGEPRAGTYGGRFVVREAGSYEIRLTLGDALDEQVLRQTVQVRLPTIELERPRRNDADMEQFATMTGGQIHSGRRRHAGNRRRKESDFVFAPAASNHGAARHARSRFQPSAKCGLDVVDRDDADDGVGDSAIAPLGMNSGAAP